MGKLCRVLILGLLLLSAGSFARADAPPEAKKPDAEAVDRVSTSTGEVTVEGQLLKYKATAGQQLLRDDAGKPKAEMFFVAYERTGEGSAETRPITFVFNGGPGAAAVWLHLGTAGPRRVALNEQGLPAPAPYHLQDNPDSWLGATDLVFIDPVGTGYSRPLPGEKPDQFYGVEQDIHSVGEFIRLYITRNKRWLSPKFLAGESYGTTRAAGLSQHLLESEGISLNGIILISSVLNFRTLAFDSGNELPYALYLPNYTAIAHHFHKLSPELQNADLTKTLHEVETWAMHDYLAALVAGASLAPDVRKTTAERFSRYSGLPVDVVEKGDLKIDPGAFRKLLLADQRLMLGRFDARIAGHEVDPLFHSNDYDPSLPPYLALYTADINDYLRQTLKFETDRSYDVLTGRVQPWNFGPAGNGFLDVGPSLQDALIKNPNMKVMFCNGTADLATPYMAARYTINSLNLSDALRANITHHLYEGGHMLYHNRASLQKLGEDVRAFIRESAPVPAPAPATQPSSQPAPAP